MKRYSNLDDWRVFRLVAQTGSIQRVADKLGVDASSISRTISTLEKSLHVALVDRHQRPFGLTTEGQVALKHCDKIIQEHDLMLEQLLCAPDSMKGTLRVGVPPAVLDNFLIGPLAQFHEKYPDLFLDVVDWHSSLPVSFVSPNGLRWMSFAVMGRILPVPILFRSRMAAAGRCLALLPFISRRTAIPMTPMN